MFFMRRNLLLNHPGMIFILRFLFCLQYLRGENDSNSNTDWSQRPSLHQTVITKVSITNLLSNQTSWDTNRTTPFQFHLRPTDFDAWNCSLWAPSSQVESCPPDARRPLSRPQTPATQYLSQNITIQWLLSPSSLELQRFRTATAKCACTRTNAVVRLVWILTENVFERSFRWHNPSLGRRDRDSGEQTTNLEKTEWP